ncbi:kinesin motor domain-containing protein [Haematococcus lacustris]|uniref:Kinesin-like protein n=1 Tax=Haematococcus lacustris TaxID=44745 RepID=A0A699ZB58_HAELA|nr:kinesin motor domain-containing protein [Haematococcus lacustris]
MQQQQPGVQQSANVSEGGIATPSCGPLQRRCSDSSHTSRQSDTSLCDSIPSASSAPPLGQPVTDTAAVEAQPGTMPLQPHQTRPAGGSDWFSNLFRRDRPVLDSARPDATHLTRNDQATSSKLSQPEGYYRYVYDPVDVAAEMEVTARVRKAAAEALMEAQERIKAAEEAQAAMQQQLGQAEQLKQEIAKLKAENEATLLQRRAQQDAVIAVNTELESMQAAQQSLQQELETMRTQTSIWQNESSGESEKLKQENALLRNQMHSRLSDLQITKNKLAEAEAEKQRLQRDAEERNSRLQWLQRINTQLESSVQQLELFRKQAAEFQERFHRERQCRRRLHEQLQQQRGNIRVMCRVRPVQDGHTSIVSCPLEGLIIVSPPDRRPQEFEYDCVFAGATQEVVYAEVSPLVRSCADGHNVCIFAYGQTGSGKTHTMQGTAEQPGLNLRSLQDLFAIADEESRDCTWQLKVSMAEIYNDAVYDLLCPPGNLASTPLEVSGLGPGELPLTAERVLGLTWRTVSSLEQVLVEGSANRTTASTALNASSSRSHALLSVRITATAADGRTTTSTLHLVDLAGSERVHKSEVVGQQLKEAQSINKSLSALGDVVSALQRRTPHVPFRNSKLTQVLQDALSASSKVLLVCNVAPEAASASETLSSLNFAARAAQVELSSRKASERANPPALPPVAHIGLMPERSSIASCSVAASAAAAASASNGGGGGAPPGAAKQNGLKLVRCSLMPRVHQPLRFTNNGPGTPTTAPLAIGSPRTRHHGRPCNLVPSGLGQAAARGGLAAAPSAHVVAAQCCPGNQQEGT